MVLTVYEFVKNLMSGAVPKECNTPPPLALNIMGMLQQADETSILYTAYSRIYVLILSNQVALVIGFAHTSVLWMG